MCGRRGCWALGVVWVLGCGGAEKPNPGFPPNPPPNTTEEAADESWVTETPSAAAPEPEPTEAPVSAEPKKPEFTPGMSVNDAIAAVPAHYDYIGLDQEVLAKPLMDLATYKDCKVTAADKFKVKLAVWEGKVVGADVTAANPAKKECIDRVIRALEYEEKVESINTVEYTF